MQLNATELSDAKAWKAAGYQIPEYNRDKVIADTAKSPVWIHFGAGNIFRAFQANVVEKLLHNGLVNRGIVVAEGYDYEIVEKICQPYQNYNILATLKADGSIEKKVIGSITESLILDSEDEVSFARLKEIFQNATLQMASFTITEKGYVLTDSKNEWYPAVKTDMENGPSRPVSYIGKVAALLYERFLAGQLPLSMVSMDNCSHNGTKLYNAITAFSKIWEENELVKEGFYGYTADPSKVSFPWSMIDKITPRPSEVVEKMLQEDGVEGIAPVITTKKTYIAPFVNAEECEYLVIEDLFPNGRPPLEKGGIIFTDRETVDKVEKMKVCTCLNPLHTSLAIYGCLLGYQLISEEMKDPALRKLAKDIGYVEGLPVVVDPGILDPKEFIDTVITTRLPNPFMPDSPQRIATDTSQKLAIRFGETIKSYIASQELDVSSLKLIPLVFAGWLRYLMGIDDKGEPFELSPDPLLATVCPTVAGIKLGETIDVPAVLAPILKNKAIFGVDLYAIGMDVLICDYFSQMIQAPGAIRNTLNRYVLG